MNNSKARISVILESMICLHCTCNNKFNYVAHVFCKFDMNLGIFYVTTDSLSINDVRSIGYTLLEMGTFAGYDAQG